MAAITRGGEKVRFKAAYGYGGARLKGAYRVDLGGRTLGWVERRTVDGRWLAGAFGGGYVPGAFATRADAAVVLLFV